MTGLTSDYTGTSFNVTTGLTSGTDYVFKVSAKNAHGWSTESATETIRTSAEPVTMSAVTTSVVSSTNVRITWSTGNANGEATIDAYKILILQSDGTTYTEDTTNCNGALSGIKSQLYCDIPFATLVASPYSLPYGTLIQATV